MRQIELYFTTRLQLLFKEEDNGTTCLRNCVPLTIGA